VTVVASGYEKSRDYAGPEVSMGEVLLTILVLTGFLVCVALLFFIQ
jgi:hypothetical protein